MKNRELGIYVHIPFCKHKCDYCDFMVCNFCIFFFNFTKTLSKKKCINSKRIESNPRRAKIQRIE